MADTLAMVCRRPLRSRLRLRRLGILMMVFGMFMGTSGEVSFHSEYHECWGGKSLWGLCVTPRELPRHISTLVAEREAPTRIGSPCVGSFALQDLLSWEVELVDFTGHREVLFQDVFDVNRFVLVLVYLSLIHI